MWECSHTSSEKISYYVYVHTTVLEKKLGTLAKTCFLRSVFIQWRLLLKASLILSDQLRILPHGVPSPNHLCDSIPGPSESPLPTRRSQGASMLELNSFAFWWHGHLFQIWVLRLAQHGLVSTLQSNPTIERREGMKNFHSFPSVPWQLPIQAITSPNVA